MQPTSSTGTTYCVRCDKPQPCHCHSPRHAWRAVEHTLPLCLGSLTIREALDGSWHWIVRRQSTSVATSVVVAHGYARTETLAKRAARNAAQETRRATKARAA